MKTIKKILLVHIWITFSLALVLSCRQSYHKDTTSLEDKDSISTMVNNIDEYYGDGVTFDVRGYVKEVKYDTYSINFNEEGIIDNGVEYYRDEKNRITSRYHAIYEYNSEGWLALEATSGGSATEYEYDDKGYRKKWKEDAGGTIKQGTYTYTKIDEHGNWLIREDNKGNIDKRSIVYWTEEEKIKAKEKREKNDKEAIALIKEWYDKYIFGNSNGNRKVYSSFCSEELIQEMIDKFDYDCFDEDCFATNIFRTTAPDGDSNVSRLESVTPMGNLTYKIIITDMGHNTDGIIRCSVEDGKIKMREVVINDPE